MRHAAVTKCWLFNRYFAASPAKGTRSDSHSKPSHWNYDSEAFNFSDTDCVALANGCRATWDGANPRLTRLPSMWSSSPVDVRLADFSDGMRRPVSRGMRYAPNVSTCSKHKEKETGNAED
jgi:hypothetical protein